MRSSIWVLGSLALASMLTGELAIAQGDFSGGIYSCTDANGRKLTSDRPIADCMDREQKLLNPSGTVRARLGPTLTAQERNAAEAKEKQAAELRAQQLEDKRRERALLIRYPTREVHDKERANALAQVASVVQAAKRRVDELQADRARLDSEMEFYKKDPSKAPLSMRRQGDDIVQGLAAQKRFIAEQDSETRRINARFDEELSRLKELWVTQGTAKPVATSGKKSY